MHQYGVRGSPQHKDEPVFLAGHEVRLTRKPGRVELRTRAGAVVHAMSTAGPRANSPIDAENVLRRLAQWHGLLVVDAAD